jgi:hypothetical protein
MGRRSNGQITIKFKIDSAGGWLPGAITWWAIGGTAGSDVTAVASGYGAFELFMRDVSTNLVMHKSWRMNSTTPVGTWLPSSTGWTSLGGGATTDQPAAVLRPTSGAIIDVFARGSDGALRARSFDATSRQYTPAWRVIGSEKLVAGTSPSAAPVGASRVDLFACSASRGPRYGIHGWWTAADGWKP